MSYIKAFIPKSSLSIQQLNDGERRGLRSLCLLKAVAIQTVNIFRGCYL